MVGEGREEGSLGGKIYRLILDRVMHDKFTHDRLMYDRNHPWFRQSNKYIPSVILIYNYLFLSSTEID